jgi:hypothetical protein
MQSKKYNHLIDAVEIDKTILFFLHIGHLKKSMEELEN